MCDADAQRYRGSGPHGSPCVRLRLTGDDADGDTGNSGACTCAVACTCASSRTCTVPFPGAFTRAGAEPRAVSRSDPVADPVADSVTDANSNANANSNPNANANANSNSN